MQDQGIMDPVQREKPGKAEQFQWECTSIIHKPDAGSLVRRVLPPPRNVCEVHACYRMMLEGSCVSWGDQDGSGLTQDRNESHSEPLW